MGPRMIRKKNEKHGEHITEMLLWGDENKDI